MNQCLILSDALKPKHTDRKVCKGVKLSFLPRMLVKVMVSSHKLPCKNKAKLIEL